MNITPEPLSDIQLKLSDTVNKSANFRSQNDPKNSCQYDTVIKQRGLKIVCYTVRGIIHRQYSNKEAETTLLVLILRFHSDGRNRRIKRAKIDITWVRSDQSGNDPEVALVYPHGSFALYPTKRTETACNRVALTATTGLVAVSEVGAEQPREKTS